jgi:hypothetical protein
MAISGKPNKPDPADSPARPNELDVLSLINKGGSIAKTSASKIDADNVKPMLVQLRLYPDLVQEIDTVRKARGSKRHPAPSRHAWIVSAIEEKLARDKVSN